MNKLSGLLVAILVFVSRVVPAQDSPLSAGSLLLPAVIGHNMVLQQGQPVPVWGWAEPGAAVSVRFASQTAKTRADKSGRWEVRLKSLKASAVPADLVISSSETLTLTNILVGEVWLASGQSNMEKPIGNQAGQHACFNAEAELAAANFPLIRIFKVEKGTMSATPLKEVKRFHSWRECSSNSLNGISFSAAAYFFARDIHTNLNVPVGVIESSWGGTRIEPWTSASGFESVRSVAEFGRPQDGTNDISRTRPMMIYNAMIVPLVPYAIRGALWYQGESNCTGETNRLIYTDKMRALINGWRGVWKQGDFPFYYVQIAPFHYSARKVPPLISEDVLPVFWESQTKALAIRNTGMIVTTDLVDNLADIHPRNKQDVGRRLALVALNKTYKRRDLACSGPVFERMKVRGNTAELTFDELNGGLMSKDGQTLSWFTIAGADGRFVPATAVLNGPKVIVSSPEVAKPVAVRFAWNESAQPNFFNQAGLPAVPFRTDAVK